MLGDNRNNSADARYWSDPYVPEDKILAKVLFRYFRELKKSVSNYKVPNQKPLNILK